MHQGRAKLVKHYQQEYELRRQQMDEERLKRERNQMKEQEARQQWLLSAFDIFIIKFGIIDVT